MSIATNNVDDEIKRLIKNTGKIPTLVKVSRSDFADLFIDGYVDELEHNYALGDKEYSYRGIKIDVQEASK